MGDKYKELLKRIENLEKQNQDLRDQINNLNGQLSVLISQGNNQPKQYIPSAPYVNIPDLCNDGKDHEYPFPWHSVTAPNCKKCGKQAPSFEITYTSNVNNDKVDYYSIHENYQEDDTNLISFNTTLKNFNYE